MVYKHAKRSISTGTLTQLHFRVPQATNSPYGVWPIWEQTGIGVADGVTIPCRRTRIQSTTIPWSTTASSELH